MIDWKTENTGDWDFRVVYTGPEETEPEDIKWNWNNIDSDFTIVTPKYRSPIHKFGINEVVK